MLTHCLSLLLLSTPIAQDPLNLGNEKEAPKKVEVGKDLPGPIRVLTLTGPKKHSYQCPITANELNPAAMVLINGTSNLKAFAPLLKELEMKARNNAIDVRLAGFVVVYFDKQKELNDLIRDDDKIENIEKSTLAELPAVASLDKIIITIAPRKFVDAYLPKEKGLGTVVLYNRYKVVEIFTFADGAEVQTKAPSVIQSVSTKLGAKK